MSTLSPLRIASMLGGVRLPTLSPKTSRKLFWTLGNYGSTVFDGAQPQWKTVLSQVANEGHLWCLARASDLQELL
ncbi:hypothetical protein U9M48_042153 [Paspalum notatum var. saurae]|uniref:Uncharacterized protein n=1 Tax=Paspalum notatum var. saurae TaxID=547442 RepID=A0AAQ3XEY0_PASNO